MVFALGSVDINSASLQQLDEITGVGPATAQKIINARPFSSVDDLLRVKGIGSKTLQKIKDQGVACVNCQTEVSATIQTTSLSPSVTPTTETQTSSPSPTPETVYPTGVFINEIMPNPKGPDETDEWIELYNSNNFDVDLSGWQLQDQKGTITTYTISTNTQILANSFLVFKRPETNIMLNNDSDGLNLLTPDGKTEDVATFTSAPLNQSYNKKNSAWVWSTTATPGSANIITALTTTSKNITNSLSKSKNSDNNKVETSTADLSSAINPNQDSNISSPWFLFFTALIATFILAALVLFIKLKLQKNVRT